MSINVRDQLSFQLIPCVLFLTYFMEMLFNRSNYAIKVTRYIYNSIGFIVVVAELSNLKPSCPLF